MEGTLFAVFFKQNKIFVLVSCLDKESAVQCGCPQPSIIYDDCALLYHVFCPPTAYQPSGLVWVRVDSLASVIKPGVAASTQ